MIKILRMLAAGALVAIGAPVVSADPAHERPRITVLRWADPPVTAAGPGCEDPETCHEESLIVRAHDPDSSITEVQVWFGEGAPFVFAHTGCVQGVAPGTPARLRIGVSYEVPGTYVVRAVAYSHPRCLAHATGDEHRQRHSPEARLKVGVKEPL